LSILEVRSRRARAGVAEALHLILEALKAAFADRERFYGDPRLWMCQSMGCCTPSMRRRA
jgi:gamma-glutamyltranspeptidase